MENALTKVYNTRRDGWDQTIFVVLWVYHTTCKKLTYQTPFRLVYGHESFIPMEYIVPSLRVATITEMIDVDAVEERLL